MHAYIQTSRASAWPCIVWGDSGSNLISISWGVGWFFHSLEYYIVGKAWGGIRSSSVWGEASPAPPPPPPPLDQSLGVALLASHAHENLVTV